MIILIAASLLGLVLVTARWFIAGDTQVLVTIARYGLIAMAFLALVLLLFSGRVSPFLIGILACLPLLGYVQSVCKLGAKIPDNLDNTSSLTREKAASMLGIDADSPEDVIKNAHKKLIQKLHPDKGGSAYLAGEINRARDVLLG